MDLSSNHALKRTAAGHRSCNRRASWTSSLSLGSWHTPKIESLKILSPCDTIVAGLNLSLPKKPRKSFVVKSQINSLKIFSEPPVVS
jgi:hypothetical protein